MGALGEKQRGICILQHESNTFRREVGFNRDVGSSCPEYCEYADEHALGAFEQEGDPGLRLNAVLAQQMAREFANAYLELSECQRATFAGYRHRLRRTRGLIFE
jgi:hypothetical protein